MRAWPHNGAMFESLHTWAAPYGGSAFLYIAFLAVASWVALLVLKPRLSTFTLKRFIRLGALIALPLTFISMEMGEGQWGLAVVAIIWAVLVAIVCQNEVSRRDTTKK
jgi:glycerol-3-phosphate acyltransferase PlsY